MVFCLRQYVLGELRMPYPKPSGSNNCKTGTAHSILWNPSWPASLALEGLHHTGNGVQRICLRASKVDGYKTTAPEIWMKVWAYTKFDYVLQVSVRISTYQTVHLHLFSRPSPIRQAQYSTPIFLVEIVVGTQPGHDQILDPSTLSPWIVMVSPGGSTALNTRGSRTSTSTSKDSRTKT